MKLTGAAIRVSRGMKVLQAAPAAYPYRSAAEQTVAKYLFVFGYESPTERKTNADQGTDFESSNAVWIEASSLEIVLAAGRQFAEDWVERLFRSAGVSDYEGWTAGNFAYWIENQPLERFSALALDTIEVITAR